jgi:hypothetical protein
MSIFNASSLRKLGTTPFTALTRRAGSNIGVRNSQFAGLLSSRSIPFSQRIESKDSGVRAPASTFEFTDEITQLAKGVTQGVRVANQENIERHAVLTRAMRRARAYNPTPITTIEGSNRADAPEFKAEASTRFSMTRSSFLTTPLNGALSLSIASERAPIQMPVFGIHVTQAYQAFDSSAQDFTLDTAI